MKIKNVIGPNISIIINPKVISKEKKTISEKVLKSIQLTTITNDYMNIGLFIIYLTEKEN